MPTKEKILGSREISLLNEAHANLNSSAEEMKIPRLERRFLTESIISQLTPNEVPLLKRTNFPLFSIRELLFGPVLMLLFATHTKDKY